MRIIYKTLENTVSVIVPSSNVNDCIKDVPKGLPYKIVEDSEVPSDRSFRDAWEITDTTGWSVA